ncbi:MAG TPA: GNAT family N-acetyltransferase [Ktedonobacterales bacterium]
MNPTIIRTARQQDFAAILAINAEGQPGVSTLTHSELVSALATGAVWVAEGTAGLAGYLIAYRSDAVYDGEEFAWFQSRYSPFLYIDQVAVASQQRRAAVGFQLYQKVERAAREQGVFSLVCEVNLDPPNPVSLAFHTRNDFHEVGVLDTRDGRKVTLLLKRLAE